MRLAKLMAVSICESVWRAIDFSTLSPGAEGSPQSTPALVMGVKVGGERVTGDVSFRNPSMPTHPAHLDVSLRQSPARSPEAVRLKTFPRF